MLLFVVITTALPENIMSYNYNIFSILIYHILVAYFSPVLMSQLKVIASEFCHDVWCKKMVRLLFGDIHLMMYYSSFCTAYDALRSVNGWTTFVFSSNLHTTDVTKWQVGVGTLCCHYTFYMLICKIVIEPKKQAEVIFFTSATPAVGCDFSMTEWMSKEAYIAHHFLVNLLSV